MGRSKTTALTRQTSSGSGTSGGDARGCGLDGDGEAHAETVDGGGWREEASRFRECQIGGQTRKFHATAADQGEEWSGWCLVPTKVSTTQKKSRLWIRPLKSGWHSRGQRLRGRWYDERLPRTLPLVGRFQSSDIDFRFVLSSIVQIPWVFRLRRKLQHRLPKPQQKQI